VKIGRRVLYDAAEVDRWIEERVAADHGSPAA
jgi:predicted DNA-binding transcriptional regulator AlpA